MENESPSGVSEVIYFSHAICFAVVNVTNFAIVNHVIAIVRTLNANDGGELGIKIKVNHVKYSQYFQYFFICI